MRLLSSSFEVCSKSNLLKNAVLHIACLCWIHQIVDLLLSILLVEFFNKQKKIGIMKGRKTREVPVMKTRFFKLFKLGLKDP